MKKIELLIQLNKINELILYQNAITKKNTICVLYIALPTQEVITFHLKYISFTSAKRVNMFI